jgi:hypothetical protein
MPVDKQLLESCILEAAGDDAEMATFLRERYAKNDSAAAKFVGGFMRQSDYSKKTAEIAGQRTQFESTTQQLEQVRKALTDAETEKAKIMRELAGQRISTAKASELMKLLQEKYQLTDDDLPGMSELIETRKTGTPVDSTPSIDDRLKSFKTELMSEFKKEFGANLGSELGAMANLDIVWHDIGDQHRELTGKPLTAKERQEILKSAREENRTILSVWEEKYNVSGDTGLRMQKRDERLKAEWQSEREKAEAERASKAALEVVSPTQRDLGSGPGISQAFKTQFKTYEMDPNKQPQQAGGNDVPSVAVMPGQHVRQTGGDRGMSGAQRAAQKFLTGGVPAKKSA